MFFFFFTYLYLQIIFLILFRFFSSENGYMTNEIMKTYFQNIVFPQIVLKQQRYACADNPNPPALILLDGHATRRMPLLWEKACACNIDVYVYPPHTTHLLQPLDKTPFSELKRYLSI
ncbi:MAG: hypothetical protein LBD32_00875 [Cytophagales bacterium]|nr:hypothetical protein [Cytophagales bacterium]